MGRHWRLLAVIGLGIAVAVSTALQGWQGDTSWRPYMLAGAVMTGVVAAWQLAIAALLSRPPPVPQGVEELLASDPRQVGQYRLVGRLGAGAMGRAYLGLTAKGHYVAVKVIRSEYADDQEFRRRFAREVDAIRHVHSPYTSQLLDAGPQAQQPWMVTPYIAGPSLQAAIDTYGPWPIRSIWPLAAGVAEALAAIHHAGIIHRDLKPANILLAPDGPRVIDFGIARAADATQLTATMLRPGTPAFMAPEQALGQPITPATDIFALGVLLAYVASGRNPFGEGTGEGILYRVVHQEPDLTGIDGPLRQLVEQCLDKQPSRRPTSSQIVTLARSHIQSQKQQHWLPTPVSADTTNMINAVPKVHRQPGPQRWPANAIASAALVIALIGVAIQVSPALAWWTNNPPITPPSPSASPSLSPSPSPSPTITVPNILNFTRTAAESTLQATNIAYDIVMIDGKPATAGLVVSTNPAPGEPIPEGSKVIVNISKGNLIPVPNVIGRTEASAKAELEAQGFKVRVQPGGVVSPSLVGKVVAQNPAAGVIAASDRVTVTINIGQGPSPTP